MSFVYRVRCTFSDPEVAERWLAWLHEGHLADVVAAGASSAEVFRIDAEEVVLEAVYGFSSRAAFERYEAQHAPRLRAEGLALFPLSLGLRYERTTGERA
ncbi:MAG: DUF4286 family protein [Alphaproteobacteria bacterium]|nr:DUF4286 family protein [Alphaproteobacteria bacterium]